MLEPATFVNQIFRNFGWNDNVKSFFCIVGTSWMGWGRVEWYWHTGMSYLTSLNTQLFKNIAYVGSFGHILFNLIFNVNSNLAESSANSSEYSAGSFTLHVSTHFNYWHYFQAPRTFIPPLYNLKTFYKSETVWCAGLKQTLMVVKTAINF